MASLRAAPLPRAISSPSRRAAGARRARPCAGAAAAEAKTVASSAHSDAELLALLEGFTASEQGVQDDSLLAESFEFIAPVVGPLPKEDYLRAVRSFGFADAFSDRGDGIFGQAVDPVTPDCVWFMSRFQGTHTGTLAGVEPTNIKVQLPPTASSVTFDANGKATKFTTGYVADRTQGNSGGLSALFGILYAIGKPLPFREAQPYKPSWRFRFFRVLGNLRRN